MIALQVADLVVIAGRVLGVDTDAALDLLDPEAAGRALMHVPPGAEDDPAGRAAGLLHALVRQRPFRRGNRQVALMATVQFLALNGWRVDLDPPEETEALMTGLASGGVSAPGLAAWLAPRLRPCGAGGTDTGNDSRTDTGTKEAAMRWLPGRRRRGQPQGMFARFTPRGRHAVMLAQEEARLLNHNYIGTEHILLGLIHEGEGVAAKALESLGISLEAVRTQVVEIIGEGKGAPSGHIPFTPRAKKVLELSLREALRLGHNYIGTEHILLGLIREGEGLAAQILVRHGADLRQVRQHVLRLVNSPVTPEAGTPPHLREIDDRISDVRRRKDAAIDEGAMEQAMALRGTEKELLDERTRLEREWAAGVDATALLEENRRLRQEVERLCALLFEHGIEPDGGESRSA